MATRHNLCPNPAIGVDVTGWGGSNQPSRQAVTGFVRPWAARYLSSYSFALLPRVAVTPGVPYTFSLYAQMTSGFGTFTINSYLGWYTTSGGGGGQFDQLNLGSFATNAVVRLSRTGTPPPGKAFADLVLDTWGGNHNFLDLTALLMEQTDGPDTYADGDSAGWEWDGTAGLSASSESAVETGLPGRIGAPSATSGLVVASTARALLGAIT